MGKSSERCGKADTYYFVSKLLWVSDWRMRLNEAKQYEVQYSRNAESTPLDDDSARITGRDVHFLPSHLHTQK
jgi:hypothetical protein